MPDQRNIIRNISVPMNRMLYSTCRNTEIHRILRCIIIHQAINNAAYKCISASDPVEDMKGQTSAFINLSIFPQICQKAVFAAAVCKTDMSGNTFVFVDDGSYYPLHSIYYITGQSYLRLRLLAAFLMSDFVRDQLSAVTNAMNGGFSRWQSQHLRKLRIPDINTVPATDAQQILSFYECKEVSSINHIINRLYGA